ncbi:MAG: glycosyltransferase family A protein [Patescibacteria group bacterium]|nr:glycosyltransferase family 2 protein [Patescibacteria group bacterium]
MKKPYFSVIIPVLNEEDYISTILKSLSDQTYQNFEVIVVDNGSTDRTLSLVDTLKVKYSLDLRILHCKRRGISYARNFAIDRSKGEYLIFYDADGKIHREWLNNAQQRLAKHPNTVAITGIYYYGPTKSILKSIYFNSYLFFQYVYIFLNYLILGKCNLIGNSLLIQKDAMVKIGGFPDVVHEDIFLMRKFSKYFNNRDQIRLGFDQVITYSPRRFEKRGYLRTLLYWIKNMIKPDNPSDYTSSK